jgi:alkylation response protein AidB-like acyl-CoA dehydrogenase
VDLGFNEEQEIMRQTAKRFLAQECPSSLVRELLGGETGHSPELWHKMADLGWLGIVFPEEHGGVGGSLLDLAALAEEFGKALVPSTFYSTGVAALAILNGGTEAQKSHYLPLVSQGKALVSLALTEPGGSYDPAFIETRAHRQDDQWVINGTKLFVPDAQSAEYLIVVARTSDGPPREGLTAFIVPTTHPGVSIEPLITFAGDRQAEVGFEDVRVGSETVLGEPETVWPAIEKTVQQQTALQLADLVGVGQHVLDSTVEYVKIRFQFERPIGSFQAVWHHCANMATDVDGARLLAYDAIWRLSQGLPATKELSMAKSWGTEAVKRVTVMSHQLHGGIGYVTEYDLHMYSARAKAAEQILGTPAEHLEIVAQQMGM